MRNILPLLTGSRVGCVDRPFSNGGQLTCREDASPDAILMKTVMVLLGHLMPQHKIFVNEISAPLRGLIM